MVRGNLIYCFLNFVMIWTSVNAKDEIFSATTSLEKLFDTQKHVIESLEDYLERETKKLDNITKLLNICKTEDENLTTDFMENPFNAFRMLKWLIHENNFAERESRMHASFHLDRYKEYPSTKDRIGAAVCLARLQKTYMLNITAVADGDLKGIASPPISSDDCAEIGSALLEAKDFESGIVWTEVAYKKFRKEDEMFNESLMRRIAFQASQLYFSVDKLNLALKYIRIALSVTDPKSREYQSYHRTNSLFQDLVHEEHIDKIHSSVRIVQKSNENKIKPKKKTHNAVENEVYYSHCRREHEVARKVNKKLKCIYSRGTHPFLTIAPIKMEQLYFKPNIQIMHDVLTDDEIEHLINISKIQLKKSTITGAHVDSPDTLMTRTSKLTWIPDDQSAVVARITRRVATITGLSVDFSEPLQVANYGIGGHFHIHMDASQIFRHHERGQRIATVLFYLTDVELGGATVFKNVGLSVTPKKGAALFWYNLHSSGDVDLSTYHAGCPVLYGHKWIATKWLFQKGNEFLAPCNLKRHSSTNNIKRKNGPQKQLLAGRKLLKKLKKKKTKKRKKKQ